MDSGPANPLLNSWPGRPHATAAEDSVMNKNVKLLLIENVESLGIVGDVVNVRFGYARNFLLPRNLATTPSDDLIKDLAGKRADAQKLLAEQRKQREALTAKLQGVEIELVRPCNDQGILYGGITQQEIATALNEKGLSVKARDIRLNQSIKRVDTYDVHAKLDSDLDATIKLHVKADRELAKDEAADQVTEAMLAREERRDRRDEFEDRRQKKINAIEEALSRAAAESGSKKDKEKAEEAGKKGKKAKAKA